MPSFWDSIASFALAFPCFISEAMPYPVSPNSAPPDTIPKALDAAATAPPTAVKTPESGNKMIAANSKALNTFFHVGCALGLDISTSTSRFLIISHFDNWTPCFFAIAYIRGCTYAVE